MAGGAADLDGRVQVGDEITHINGHSVVNASHREVISLMGEAAAQGEVVLGIRRKMPMSESVPPPGSYGSPHQQYRPDGVGVNEPDGPEPLELPKGPREVIVSRPNITTSFGFVLQSNTLRAGCMICECAMRTQSTCLFFYQRNEFVSNISMFCFALLAVTTLTHYHLLSLHTKT